MAAELERNNIEPKIIEQQKQTEFLREFTKLLAIEIAKSPELRAKTDQIFKTQVEPLIEPGKTLIFVDSGMKGTIPALLAALVKIKMAERAGRDLDTYMAENPNDVRIFVHSVDSTYEKVIPHFSVGRTKGKPVEDAGKFGRLDLREGQVKIKNTGVKDSILAALDLTKLF